MRALVITPTIGTKFLQQAIDSVKNQTVPTEHWIIVDGKLEEPFNLYENGSHIVWPENIGGNGWNGHRHYAAVPMMTNADYIFYLDEDNWFEPEHVENMISFIKKHDLAWAYSLRNIVSQEGEFIAKDDCESLGRWPSVFAQDKNFVDTNCYCFKRKFLARVSPYFYGSNFYQDRLFYNDVAKTLPDFECTGEHTVNYRVRKANEHIYAEGNRAVSDHFKGKLPWHHFKETK